jgi:sugar phosphate isomerase/epimerase
MLSPQLNLLPKSGLGQSFFTLGLSLQARKIDFGEGPHQLSTVDLNFLKEKLYQLYYQHSVKSKEYGGLAQRLEEERRLRAKPYFEAAKMSLDRLANSALKREVRLGIETRDSFHEIPQFDEMENILEEFEGGPIGYWHDVGHAEKTSRLGFTPHGDWLSRFKERMIGVHLHDVTGLQDHYLIRKYGLGFRC